MALDRYVLHAVKVGSTVVPGLSGQSFNAGVVVARPVTDGGIDASFSSLIGAAPSYEFTTHDILGAIAAFGLLGGDIAALTSVAMQFRKQDVVGTASGSVHATITATKGVVYPVSLNLAQGAVGTITYRIVPASSNGVASPVVRASNVALHAIAAPFVDGLTLGEVHVNGSAIDSPVSASVSFGIPHYSDTDSGLPYPKVVFLQSRTPTISVQHRDAGFVVPAALSGAGLEVFLRRLTNGALPAASASTVHALLTAGAGTIHETGVSSSGFVADAGFVVECTKPSAADVLVWATGQAIA